MEWKIEIEKALEESYTCNTWNDCLMKSDSLVDFFNNLVECHNEITRDLEDNIQEARRKVKFENDEWDLMKEELESKKHYIDFNEICREAHPNLKLDMSSYLHREKVIEALKIIQF